MTQFDIDYKRGKESEIESLPDIQKIFGDDIKFDPYQFAHFDYFSDTYMVELKTRDRVKYIDGQYLESKHNLCRKDVIFSQYHTRLFPLSAQTLFSLKLMLIRRSIDDIFSYNTYYL